MLDPPVSLPLYDPQNGPIAYPVCVECRIPHVLRYGLSLSQGGGWYWYRDCKHKTADAELVHMEAGE